MRTYKPWVKSKTNKLFNMYETRSKIACCSKIHNFMMKNINEDGFGSESLWSEGENETIISEYLK